MCTCARTRQKSEDMTGGRNGTKVRVVEMKGETKRTGTPDEAHLIVKTWAT